MQQRFLSSPPCGHRRALRFSPVAGPGREVHQIPLAILALGSQEELMRLVFFLLKWSGWIMLGILVIRTIVLFIKNPSINRSRHGDGK
ncbi:MAG: hypothetical protein HYZ51_04915 [Candidatus Doudnabacteria bacterium]|nr:hypothetical protein [Candidatus Doudnabacteria bacterium]